MEQLHKHITRAIFSRFVTMLLLLKRQSATTVIRDWNPLNLLAVGSYLWGAQPCRYPSPTGTHPKQIIKHRLHSINLEAYILKKELHKITSK